MMYPHISQSVREKQKIGTGFEIRDMYRYIVYLKIIKRKKVNIIRIWNVYKAERIRTNCLSYIK